MSLNKHNISVFENKTVGIIAPAGPMNKDLIDAAIESIAAQNCTVKVGSNLYNKFLHTAGSAEERATDFNLMCASNIDLILSLRGGFGSIHILDLIDWQLIKNKKPMLLGYSDISVLHLAMSKMESGIPVASPMAGTYNSWDKKTANSVKDAINKTPRTLANCTIIQNTTSTKVSGKPILSNLTCAASLCGTKYFPNCKDKIIFLEDVDEPVYKIDRTLTQLLMANFFDNCAGIVFGYFTNSNKEELHLLLKEFAKKLSCPIYCDFPYGHELPFVAVNFEETITMDNGLVSANLS